MDIVPRGGRARDALQPRNLMREEEAHREPRIVTGGQGATLFARGKTSLARVMNISVDGTLLESEAEVALDEAVVVAFDGCTPVHANVCWVRGSRIGLLFGRELVLA